MYYGPVWAVVPNWLQPDSTPLPNPNSRAGAYTYQIQINVPACGYEKLVMSGTFYTDNNVQAMYLNGNLITSSPYCATWCWNGTGTPTPFTVGGFQPGLNTFQIVVTNLSQAGNNWTGLAVNATLTDICSQTCSILKACKVAGPGILPGASFPFSYSSSAGSGTFTVPAGSAPNAPNGYCVLAQSFPPGTSVTMSETIPIPPTYTVSSITAAPPSILTPSSTNPNLAAGTVTVVMGSGIDDVTYTDQAIGYLEICKVAGYGIAAGSPYTFHVNPGNLGPFTIPAGACLPAIPVTAGLVTITEDLAPLGVDISCYTIPASMQGSCAQPTISNPVGTSIVTVVAGDISTQTVAFVTNQSTIHPIGPIHPIKGGSNAK
jgi:hypothetical protein